MSQSRMDRLNIEPAMVVEVNLADEYFVVTSIPPAIPESRKRNSGVLGYDIPHPMRAAKKAPR